MTKKLNINNFKEEEINDGKSIENDEDINNEWSETSSQSDTNDNFPDVQV